MLLFIAKTTMEELEEVMLSRIKIRKACGENKMYVWFFFLDVHLREIVS